MDILPGKKATGVGDPVWGTPDHQEKFFPELWQGQQYLRPQWGQGRVVSGDGTLWYQEQLQKQHSNDSAQGKSSFSCPNKAPSWISTPPLEESKGQTEGIDLGEAPFLCLLLSLDGREEWAWATGSSKFQILLSGRSLGIWNFLKECLLGTWSYK